LEQLKKDWMEEMKANMADNEKQVTASEAVSKLLFFTLRVSVLTVPLLFRL
jgi:hypothetical protein